MICALSYFRGRFVSALRSAAQAGELTGIDPGAVSAVLDTRMAEDWAVYAKPSVQYTESVIGYLARYTHRIATATRASWAWTVTRSICVTATTTTASTRPWCCRLPNCCDASCCTCCPRG